ncbi:MAG: hypothetical protein IJW82_07465, partial [Clostridia bacterium]|nr:hypothetical protein [Clostridia bacterium]
QPIQLVLPFFAVWELIYEFVFCKSVNLYYKYRYNRADETLFMYLFKKVCGGIIRFYKKTYNIFGICQLDLLVEDGRQEQKAKEKKYYLSSKKIYSERFSTDCFSDIFTQKSLKSKVGINDLEEYGGNKATFEELIQQNSYFVRKLIFDNKEYLSGKLNILDLDDDD